METAPDLEATGEEISPEISSVKVPDTEPAVEVDSYVETWDNPDSEPPQDANEFNQRVERLMAMMEDDPKVRDRLLAETYVNIASAEMGIRQMAEAVQKQGIAGLMKGAFSRGG